MENLVRDTISESLSDFLLKSQTPFKALWSLRSIDLRVIIFIYIYIFIFNSFKEGCPSTSWFSRGPPIKTLVTI